VQLSQRNKGFCPNTWERLCKDIWNVDRESAITNGSPKKKKDYLAYTFRVGDKTEYQRGTGKKKKKKKIQCDSASSTLSEDNNPDLVIVLWVQ